MSRLGYIFSFVLCLLCTDMSAQILWSCDFEDATERSQWHLNYVDPNYPDRSSRCENLWYMGSAGNYGPTGSNGLYVAQQAKKDSLIYGSQATMMAVAYRELTLPKGDYNIRFDRIGRMKDTGEEGVYVFWVPDTEEAMTMVTTSMMPWMQSNNYRLRTTPLFGNSYWQADSLKLHIADVQETRRLMFVFFTSKGMAVNPSFAIDNIEIYVPVRCPQPTNIQEVIKADGTLDVKWRSISAVDSYEFQLCDMEKNIWKTQIVENGSGSQKVLTMDGLEEGVYLVRIRALCGDNHSEWSEKMFLYFQQGKRCIDYMKLDNTTCSYSMSAPTLNGEGTSMALPERLSTKGIYGSGDFDDYFNTTHALHYIPGETDPFTDGNLKTKPDGALASVRIGRYAPTHISRVEYEYSVPESEEQILVIRYALVLPNPHPEIPVNNPTFMMTTTIDGKPVPNGCGDANFTSGYTDTDWHESLSGDLYTDWKTVSLNMKEYKGKKFKMVFTTTGCTFSAHGGYAYLTVSCETGQMSGLNCGEDNTETNVSAPAGFSYRWWKDLDVNGNKIVLPNGNKRSYTIPAMDTATYHVDLISLGNAECYHTLDVRGIPRLPHTEAGISKIEEVKCQNVVTFYNNSYLLYKAYKQVWVEEEQNYVMVVDREFTKGEPLDDIVWDWGDGSERESNPDSLVSHIYPKTGGEYTVWMIGALNGTNHMCLDSVAVKVTVPQVGYADVELHEAKGYQFRYTNGAIGNTYWSVGSDTVVEMIGDCERLWFVNIHETKFNVDTFICEGGQYRLGDTVITTSGVYTRNIPRVVYPKLDSIVTLNVHVEPRLMLGVADTTNQCLDEKDIEIAYEVLQGNLGDITLVFDSAAQAAGFEAEYVFDANEEIRLELPDSIEVGYYNYVLKLGTEQCPVPDLKLVLQVSYPSSVVKVKDGVLVVQNEEFSGYRFDGYQWYKNGMPVEGATESYLPMSNADAGAEFTAMLKREGCPDVPFCPIVFKEGATASDDIEGEILLSPTYVGAGETIYINKQVSMTIYNALGLLVDRIEGSAQMKAPMTQGVYFGVTDNSKKVIRFVVH